MIANRLLDDLSAARTKASERAAAYRLAGESELAGAAETLARALAAALTAHDALISVETRREAA